MTLAFVPSALAINNMNYKNTCMLSLSEVVKPSLFFLLPLLFSLSFFLEIKYPPSQRKTPAPTRTCSLELAYSLSIRNS